jgi:cytochrome c oxidase subunit 4
MADPHHDHASHDAHFGHPVPVKLLLAVFVCLVSLTILTVLVNDLSLGKLDIWVALTIATIKASLVCLFFMHMYWEKGFNVIAFFTSLLFVTLFIGITLMDTGAYRDLLDKYPREKRPAPPVPVVDVASSPDAA